MKTIQEAAHEYFRRGQLGLASAGSEYGFIAGVEYAQQWIDVEDELPKANKEEEGILYSDYVLIKIKEYEHPFVGYYVNACDDEFFDFTPEILLDIKQDEITHWRPIEYK